MRVFVTGATGFVGSAVVQELLKAGHQVLGLARSAASVSALIAAGAEAHRGDLEDLDSLRSGAAAADGIIHTGFIHDFTRFKEVCETDRKVIQTLGSALAGTDKPFVITSGIALVAQDQPAIESDRAMPGPNPRLASEEAADAVAATGVRVSVVRLPPSVHDAGDHGFVPMLINIAREKGVSAYQGDGNNRWPAVHRLDAAEVFCKALEASAIPGIRYHAVAEEGIPFREIAAVIGKRLNLPVVSKTPEETAAHFAWFTHFATLNTPASGIQTKEQLNWTPTHKELLEDVDSESYFPE